MSDRIAGVAGPVHLRRVIDVRGSITVLEEDSAPFPFPIRRVFFLNDVPWGTKRWSAEHEGVAFREQTYLYVVASGSCRLYVHDGVKETEYELIKPNEGVLLPPLNWRRFSHFASGTVVVGVASGLFDDFDYVRDFEEFRALASIHR